MKVLLTGKPGAGKSVTLNKIVDMIGRNRCAGLITTEILENSERVGFKTHALYSDEDFILAHKTFDKKYAVEDFGVNVEDLDRVFAKEAETILNNDNIKFIIIDEIGRMQALSDKFKETLDKLADCSKVMIGTVCYEDEIDYIRDFKKRNDVTIYTLDLDNRDVMPIEIVRVIMSEDDLYLSKIALAKYYKKDPSRYEYEGNKVIIHSTHGTRIVTKEKDMYKCTCHYYEENGVCSHILSLIM